MVALPGRSAAQQARQTIEKAPGKRAPITAASAVLSTPTDTAGPAGPRRTTGQAGGGDPPAPEAGGRNTPTRASTARRAAGRPAAKGAPQTEGAAMGGTATGRAATTAAAARPEPPEASPATRARRTATPARAPRSPAGRAPAGRAERAAPRQAHTTQAEQRTRPEPARGTEPQRGAHDGRTQKPHGVCGGGPQQGRRGEPTTHYRPGQQADRPSGTASRKRRRQPSGGRGTEQRRGRATRENLARFLTCGVAVQCGLGASAYGPRAPATAAARAADWLRTASQSVFLPCGRPIPRPANITPV